LIHKKPFPLQYRVVDRHRRFADGFLPDSIFNFLFSKTAREAADESSPIFQFNPTKTPSARPK
jgi:hypothetical protein